jgi:hypothetical protein
MKKVVASLLLASVLGSQALALDLDVDLRDRLTGLPESPQVALSQEAQDSCPQEEPWVFSITPSKDWKIPLVKMTSAARIRCLLDQAYQANAQSTDDEAQRKPLPYEHGGPLPPAQMWPE